ncbi:MAG: metalloregulator ArsR/SmtB family transcription factor [Neptuniibacter sp.]
MKTRVLFLCTANSARSQMAEAILKNLAGDQFEVVSAGTHPTEIDPRTLSALVEHKIDIYGLCTKSVADITHKKFDYVISLCQKAHEDCQNWPGSGVIMTWDFSDPRTSKDPLAFNHTLVELKERIRLFIQVNQKEIPPFASITPVIFFKSLADENRLKSLLLISQEGELCVCELMQALGESQPKISRHLAQLKKNGLLLDRRQGQWVYYRLNPDLENWMLNVIDSTAKDNQRLITEELDLLKSMPDRPENNSICC